MIVQQQRVEAEEGRQNLLASFARDLERIEHAYVDELPRLQQAAFDASVDVQWATRAIEQLRRWRQMLVRQ